jgi:hypothetical protein
LMSSVRTDCAMGSASEATSMKLADRWAVSKDLTAKVAGCSLKLTTIV